MVNFLFIKLINAKAENTFKVYDEEFRIIAFIIFMLFIHIICHLYKDSQMIISKYFSHSF